MRILIIGADGQIGWELCRALGDTHDVLATTRSQIDMTDFDSIRGAIRQYQPQLVINAAGYTAVDRAEQEPQLAMTVNGEAVGVIGEECRKLSAAVIHYSTDYVFDGTSSTVYLPTSPANPISAYGLSKLAGEKALRASGANHLILRTCWVYGGRGNNFLITMLRLGRERPELRIVNDQTGSPTWSRDIAHATADIIDRSIRPDSAEVRFPGGSGIHHLAASGQTTWFDFAGRIFELAGFTPLPRLIPITAAQYAAPAKRPAFSVLDCSSAAQTFGIRLPNWQDSLRTVMAELQANRTAHHGD